MYTKNKDYIGKTLGFLTILETLPKGKVKCQCDCGTLRLFNWRDIRRGRTKGCGCRRNTPELRKIASKRAKELIKKGILNKGGDNFPKENRSFKFLLHRIKKGFKRKPCYLSVEDLKSIWEKQKGKCAYTNIALTLPIGFKKPNPKVSYLMASVDRIDSSKPYQKNNIQFVSRNINYAKNNLSHEEMINFFNLIKNPGGEEN